MNSLKDNFNYIISQNTCFGRSKKNDKNNNLNSKHDKIYSIEDCKGLRDTAKNFCNYMKQYHPEITQLKQVTKEHTQEWIDYRSNDWNNNTKVCHQSHFEKLNRLANKTFTSCKNKDFTKDLDYHLHEHKKTKIRDKEMDREDLNRLKESFYNSRSEVAIGLLLSESLGLRALEVVNFRTSYIDIDNKKVILPNTTESGTKGRRGRKIEIQDRYLPLFQYITNSIGYSDERLFHINEDSYNATLRRHMKSIGINDKYINTTNHSIRKLWAHELYNQYLERGYPDDLSTFDKVSEQLGHGTNRSDLYHVYIVK